MARYSRPQKGGGAVRYVLTQYTRLTAPRGGRNHTPVPAANSLTAQVRTKSVYEPVDPADGMRILTTQYWARGVPRSLVHDYVRKLGPTRELLHAFKRGEIDWEAYKTRYLREMQTDEAKREIQRLAEIAKTETITLMCVCKDENRCHRTLLRELILLQAAEGAG